MEKKTKTKPSTDEAVATDKAIFERLPKIVSPTGQDMNDIFYVYKKYINPHAQAYRIGCNTCGNSIINYWRQANEWYYKNKNNF